MRFTLGKSIIHNCPTIRWPQSWAEQLGCTTKITPIKSTEADAKVILHAMNLLQHNVATIGLLREAAKVIASLPEDVADKLQIRHFLSDELEGTALIIEGETEATNEIQKSS